MLTGWQKIMLFSDAFSGPGCLSKRLVKEYQFWNSGSVMLALPSIEWVSTNGCFSSDSRSQVVGLETLNETGA